MHKALFDHESLLFRLSKAEREKEGLARILARHPEVRFVSLVGVDLAGNDTDEKIPVALFLQEEAEILAGGITTDGSSVVLPGIASINDAKVDLVADTEVHWYVDYNVEHLDAKGRPCGTLRIPAFLRHGGRLVCSRAILRRAFQHLDQQSRALLSASPELLTALGFGPEGPEKVQLEVATELEFWVRTPEDQVPPEELSRSQNLKEQYWKRTKGVVRTALEQSLLLLEAYGFEPEMGHKEVGGVTAHLNGRGDHDHILEQLEIDWKYCEGLQAVDNALMIRILIKEVFRHHGLEASFLAKPIDGVAGSGEHTHMNLSATGQQGQRCNLFVDKEGAMTRIAWGGLMGLCKHYRALIAPFVTASNDAFRRLKPGFEAPTHVTASLSHNGQRATRNRTVLLAVLHQPEAPKSTRFELRSPHPKSNLYLALAAASLALLDGWQDAHASGRGPEELKQAFCKRAGEEDRYLPRAYAFRTEEDIFHSYDAAERDRRFGRPAGNVYETLHHLIDAEDLALLLEGQVFTDALIFSYIRAILDRWELELKERFLPELLQQVRACKFLGSEDVEDDKAWAAILAQRVQLMKGSPSKPSLRQALEAALEKKDLREAALIHEQMAQAMQDLQEAYLLYQSRLLDI